MGMIHIVPIIIGHIDNDDERVNKVFWYMIWFMLVLLGAVLGYALQSLAWGIGIVVFVILIGICRILWNKETEKERLTKKEKEDELD
jgi:uncharacterized membrane protein